jgi:NADH-quinone oxidoreductase subunit E
MDISKTEKIVKNYKDKEGALIAILQKVQELYGYLPKEALQIVALERKIPPATLYGVVTFYSQFNLTPRGKHIIRICHGTACHVTGAERTTEAISDALGVEESETTKDGMFTLEKVACLGCCSLAPCMMIDKKVYGRLTADKAKKIIKSFSN